MRKGMMLIEIIVGMLILLIVVIAIADSIGVQKRAKNRQELFFESACLLVTEMEKTKTCSFESLSSLDGRKFGGGRGELKVQPLEDNLKLVRAVIFSPPLELVTLRAK